MIIYLHATLPSKGKEGLQIRSWHKERRLKRFEQRPTRATSINIVYATASSVQPMSLPPAFTVVQLSFDPRDDVPIESVLDILDLPEIIDYFADNNDLYIFFDNAGHALQYRNANTSLHRPSF